jgi:hypothetical protein
VANGIAKKFKHGTPEVPPIVIQATKNVFEELANEELLKRCLGGYTQNPNESLNAVIWKLCPKTGFRGRNNLEAATYIAVLLFNGGQKTQIQVKSVTLFVSFETSYSFTVGNGSA